jgi:hypothetical protein
VFMEICVVEFEHKNKPAIAQTGWSVQRPIVRAVQSFDGASTLRPRRDYDFINPGCRLRLLTHRKY